MIWTYIYPSQKIYIYKYINDKKLIILILLLSIDFLEPSAFSSRFCFRFFRTLCFLHFLVLLCVLHFLVLHTYRPVVQGLQPAPVSHRVCSMGIFSSSCSWVLQLFSPNLLWALDQTGFLVLGCQTLGASTYFQVKM